MAGIFKTRGRASIVFARGISHPYFCRSLLVTRRLSDSLDPSCYIYTTDLLPYLILSKSLESTKNHSIDENRFESDINSLVWQYYEICNMFLYQRDPLKSSRTSFEEPRQCVMSACLISWLFEKHRLVNDRVIISNTFNEFSPSVVAFIECYVESKCMVWYLLGSLCALSSNSRDIYIFQDSRWMVPFRFGIHCWWAPKIGASNIAGLLKLHKRSTKSFNCVREETAIDRAVLIAGTGPSTDKTDRGWRIRSRTTVRNQPVL